jgi:hypothetical protein
MTHDQIREMVRRVNPIPDPSMLEIVDVPALTTPLERRTDMQIDDKPGAEVLADGNRRRGPLVGIAAAAVLLIAGLVLFLTRDNTPVAEPAPNATELTHEFQPLTPGAYYADTDGNEETATRGTFVIEGDGWTDVFSSGALKDGVGVLLVVEVDEVWPSLCEPTAPVAAGTTAADLANQIATNGLTVREALAPVNAFGHNGYHLVGEVPAGCGGEVKPGWTGPVFDHERWYDPGDMVEYWFLDVGGTPVMIEAGWAPGSAPEADVAELRAVLDTLVITSSPHTDSSHGTGRHTPARSLLNFPPTRHVRRDSNRILSTGCRIRTGTG